MQNDNVNIQRIKETLKILDHGYYWKKLRKTKLKLSREEMSDAYVLLPDTVHRIVETGVLPNSPEDNKCVYSCENMDSYALARKRYKEWNYIPEKESTDKILVLNLANPVSPGGGVRRGARAQEEDLCRSSSLLLSLEGEKAKEYYRYNRQLDSYLGSDAMVFSPNVEIIRDEKGELLDETVIVSVLTCAAPMILYGKEGMDDDAYLSLVLNRIHGMLKCSIFSGYRNIILGAWGCGAFGNDAHGIAELFYVAVKQLNPEEGDGKLWFKNMDFAILDRSEEKYNFNEFNLLFGNLAQSR